MQSRKKKEILTFKEHLRNEKPRIISCHRYNHTKKQSNYNKM